MAVIVQHYSRVLTRSNSGNISGRSRPPDRIPAGVSISPPTKLEKLALRTGDDLVQPSQTFKIDSGRLFVHRGCDEFQVLHSTGRTYINQMLCDYENIVRRLFAKQRMVQFKLSASAVALMVTNAAALAAPAEALAAVETCDVNRMDFNMPLLLVVSLVGATVGGLLARQRKTELSRVNEQLRQINAALRRQAKIESYAPTLSYAPVGGKIPEEVIVDPKKHELISHLKTGKIFLRNQSPDKAYVEFAKALELAQSLNDPVRVKKAARGLGASLQRQSKYKDAIKYHLMVLDISKREGETSGDTEAYGAIADCYTELGDLDQAGKFYDKYIARLETD